MIINTQISWGYKVLIEIFGQANNLDLKLEPYRVKVEQKELFSSTNTLKVEREYICISYEDNSDTAIAITCLSVKHLGFENMLCEYLIRCNVDPIMIPIGQYVMKKPEEQIEKEYQEHRRKIGLAR